ncbi:Unknown protein [Striga hermonthica]|uniref:Retrotransposon Copia-like N-terminal domain-containing protein n=1 Tax=Striga hermonthica TaxID=68872 RepID=A0A9N7RB00_STRHE|nr:Unknown protein [Striga hermonthica]
MADTTQNPLNLHGSDNPGIMLVIHQLAGNNFLSWKRSMIIALRAKTKYGFVNGDIPQPDENDEGYANWKKVDCMVLSWILNSLSKKIGESFLYADTTKELWEDICQRFGENNGPMRYKIQREISTLTQGNSTVMEYFNKLKKLWNEYACVVPLQICSEKGKLIAKQYAKTKLIQFLMGLNDVYDNVKNQIMLIDPLPSVNKAYSVLLTTERQITIQNEYGGKLDNVVMVAKSETYGKGSCGLGRGGNNGGRGWQSGGRGRGAAYIINRVPSQLLEWKTPYEILRGDVTDYKRMKPFGCLAYVANIHPHRSKLDARSSKCLFLGYAAGKKGYQLYDMEDDKLVTSRDVVFIEDTYPFQNQNTPAPTTLPLSVPDLHNDADVQPQSNVDQHLPEKIDQDLRKKSQN